MRSLAAALMAALALAAAAAASAATVDAGGAVFDPAALLSPGAFDPVVGDPCASHKTCDACLNASSLCHFCESDFECHAILSPHGCATGIGQCHHLSDCERKAPQYVGYGPPPSVVIAVLCLVVTLTCCMCGISAICTVFCRRRSPPSRQAAAVSAIRDSKKKRKQKKKKATPGSDASSDQVQPLLLAEEGVVTFHNDQDDEALDRLESRYEREEHEFNWSTFFWRLGWLGTLLGVTIFALMFYPRIPDYNVCNREFEWESIMQSLRHLEPTINYQVLISVINENRFGFVLESGRADIYHKGTYVGMWELSTPWETAAGAISDIIAPIQIKPPTVAESYALWSDFRNNELIFRINATVTGSITWGTHKIYRISSSVPDVEFLVGAEYDRGLCMCPSYATST